MCSVLRDLRLLLLLLLLLYDFVELEFILM